MPACILAMFASGWSESPSSNGQPSRAESSSAIVDLPDPDTPMITRIGGLPRWARALSRRRTPAASATKTGSARLMKSPLSTTPTMRLMRSCLDVILSPEDRRACDDGCCAGARRLGGGRRVLAAIDFDHRIEAALGAHCAQAPDLGQHFGKESL